MIPPLAHQPMSAARSGSAISEKGLDISALFRAFPQGGSGTCDVVAAGTPHSGFWLGPKGGCMAGWRDACLMAALAAGFEAAGGGTPARAEDQASARQQGQV